MPVFAPSSGFAGIRRWHIRRLKLPSARCPTTILARLPHLLHLTRANPLGSRTLACPDDRAHPRPILPRQTNGMARESAETESTSQEQLTFPSPPSHFACDWWRYVLCETPRAIHLSSGEVQSFIDELRVELHILIESYHTYIGNGTVFVEGMR